MLREHLGRDGYVDHKLRTALISAGIHYCPEKWDRYGTAAAAKANLIRESQSQPVPPDPSHRRLLAPADDARRRPVALAVALRRVQHPAPSSDQDRRARGGRRGSHPCLLAHRLSRPRCLPRTRRTALRRRAIANAAPSPQPTPRRNFQPSKIKPSRRVISLRTRSTRHAPRAKSCRRSR